MAQPEILYTETCYNTIDDRINYFSQWNDENAVIERIEELISRFENNVSDNPEIYSRCRELSEFGITDIRQFSADGFRVLYEYNETLNKITVLLLLSDKQDLQKTLVDYCLIYK